MFNTYHKVCQQVGPLTAALPNRMYTQLFIFTFSEIFAFNYVFVFQQCGSLSFLKQKINQFVWTTKKNFSIIIKYCF